MLLPAVLLGVCNDQSASCHAWAKAGECTSNGEKVRSICPVSCKLCLGGEHHCEDRHRECEELMKAGECVTRPYPTLRNCPVSCGICTPVCLDIQPPSLPTARSEAEEERETHCEARAKRGHCESDMQTMLRDCPVACGLCKPKPVDRHQDCAAWASDGRCEREGNFMLRHCPLACGLMQLKGRADVASLAGAVSARAGHGAEAFCHDSDAAACASWASQGQCESNPDFMLRSCGLSCELCSYVCEDIDPSCGAWLAAGECESNPIGMRKVCPRSCGACQALKDEL